MSFHRTGACLAGLLVFLALSGCRPAREEPAHAGAVSQTYFVVTHGSAGNPFWAVVVRGAMDAGEALGVNVQYLGPDRFSIAEFVSLIDAAIAAQPQGIAVTITDPTAVAEPLQRAADAGIPVVAINAADPDGRLPYLLYIGSDEYRAGYAGGQKMLEAGFSGSAVCASHEIGNLMHETRCRGFADALAEQGVEVVVLDITSDTVTAIEVFRSHFAAHPETGAVMTLGPDGMSSWRAFVDESGRGDVLHATFDLDPVTLDAIRDGITRFTIDQQQYLQGFQSVVTLYLKHNYELVQANDLLTGPFFVTADNIEAIAALIEEGIR